MLRRSPAPAKGKTMNSNIWEPPEGSGGVELEQSDVEARDIVGRDKIELNLSEIPRRGCYAQLSKNIKFVVSVGVLLALIYAVFQQLNRPSVSLQTPTPTVVASPTPTATPVPLSTPTVDDRASAPQTASPAPVVGSTATVDGGEEVTPVTVTATARSGGIASPTRTLRRPTATATLSDAKPPSPVVRPATPTPRPTPTPVPTTAPSATPRPAPTSTRRPPTPTPNPCPSADVRVGPVAKLVTLGDRFSISVVVSCAVNMAGYQVELRFDPAVVVVQGAGNGGFLASAGGSVFIAGPEIDNDAGKVTISTIVLRPGPYPSGSGTLASFDLEAVGLGSTDLDLSANLSDLNGQAIPAHASGGAVVVQPAAAATPEAP